MNGELLGALAVGIPSLIIGLMTFLRSRTVDAVSAQSGAASNNRAGTAQIIEGLNHLIDQLQEENLRLRTEADSRFVRLEAMTLEVARLRKKYADNGDTPQPPNR